MRRRHVAALAVTGTLLTACSAGGSPAAPSSTSTSTSATSPTTASSATTGPPATAPGVDPAAWRTVDAQTRALGKDTALFTGVIGDDGRLQVVHSVGPTGLRPLASVVKVYVLLAVIDRIDHGALTWSTQLTTRRFDLAGGSGLLAGRGVGASISVQEAARLMFQISDNTATSLLIRTVGQPALRRVVAASGHSDPAALDPFLTIRQDLWLQWSTDPRAATARSKWSGASASQRATLVAPADTAPLPDLTRSTNIWRKGLGYGGSAQDVALAWTAIADRSGKPGMAPLAKILAVPSPGFTAPSDWRTTWFKSGSLAGVVNGSWLGDGPHGRQVVVVLSASDGGPSVTAVRRVAGAAAAQLDAYAAGR